LSIHTIFKDLIYVLFILPFQLKIIYFIWKVLRIQHCEGHQIHSLNESVFLEKFLWMFALLSFFKLLLIAWMIIKGRCAFSLNLCWYGVQMPCSKTRSFILARKHKDQLWNILLITSSKDHYGQPVYWIFQLPIYK